MAAYKNSKLFTQDNSTAFDGVHNPGRVTPYSGIYGCTACGKEVVSTKGHPLPPQNHHQHIAGLPPIRWQLVAATLPV